MYNNTTPKNNRLNIFIVVVIIIISNVFVAVTAGLVVYSAMHDKDVLGRNNSWLPTEYVPESPISEEERVLLINNVIGGVVEITAIGGDKASAGSGFIVGNEGSDAIIITNHHVIKDTTNIKVKLADRAEYFTPPAKVLGYDGDWDIAVLSVTTTLSDEDLKSRTLDLGDSRELRYGQSVIAIGNALGNGSSVTEGIISIPEAIMSISDSGQQNLIQTSAAINPGNSGGPLFDTQGNVIGVNTYKLYAIVGSSEDGSDLADNVGLAIPINVARAIYGNIMTRRSNGETGTINTGNWNTADIFQLKNYQTVNGSGNTNIVKTKSSIRLSLFNTISANTQIKEINDKAMGEFLSQSFLVSASVLSELRYYYRPVAVPAHENHGDKKHYQLKMITDEGILGADKERDLPYYLYVDTDYLPEWLIAPDQ